MPIVALFKCDSYTSERIDDIVRKCISLHNFSRGDKVWVKANMLSARPVEKCVTTHPVIIDSVCRALLDLGTRPTIGDSPGIEPFPLVARISGIAEVGKRLGIPVKELSNSTVCPPNERRVNKRLELARDILESDVVVSLPKLKTHCQMQLSMAIKNLFGTVVGQRKARWHYDVGLDRTRFANVLLDITVSVPPLLSIIDGIDGMEGHGPANGTPRHFGLIGASEDPVALDATLCEMVGLSASDYVLLQAAKTRGIGDVTLSDTQYIGDLPPSYRFENVKIPTLDALRLMPRFMDTFGRHFLSSRPVQIQEDCIACGRCAAICPADALKLTVKTKTLTFDYSKCIRCYCCHEMCPKGAITFRDAPLLAVLKMLGICRV